jgi:lysophospholipase L1-like esterase
MRAAFVVRGVCRMFEGRLSQDRVSERFACVDANGCTPAGRCWRGAPARYGGVPSAAAADNSAGRAGASASLGGNPAAIGNAGRSGQNGAAGRVMPPAGDAADGDAGGGLPACDTCERGQVKADEVVFIGESFIAQTGAIPRMLSQLARDAGTIGMNESYRSSAVSGTQLTTGENPMQYATAKSASPIKVVLMDGGGNDLLFGDRCKSGFDDSCKEIVTVVDTLFKQMNTDGVQDVVYFFYPDPMGIGANIKDAMDILRPEMKKLCDGTTEVRCVWVDQRESWSGNYGSYTSDGIHPTDAGAMASAKQIWGAMVANCIAQ